jgi:hypothetical protein
VSLPLHVLLAHSLVVVGGKALQLRLMALHVLLAHLLLAG